MAKLKKLKKDQVEKLTVEQAISLLNTCMPKNGILAASLALDGLSKKGQYTNSDKLLAGSICWQLLSEGHSKAHVAKVFDRHFTWVDTMMKKAISTRSRFCSDLLALAYLSEHLSKSDVALVARGLKGTDPTNKKIALNLFKHYSDKFMVHEYQLVMFFDHVLYNAKLINAPFTGAIVSRAREWKSDEAARLRREATADYYTTRNRLYRNFPFTSMS